MASQCYVVGTLMLLFRTSVYVKHQSHCKIVDNWRGKKLESMLNLLMGDRYGEPTSFCISLN
jgi:hypothetical protein